MFKKRLLLSIVFLQAFSLLVQAQLTNGIYAIFDTTLGSFTSEIYYAEAPMAAANFIGLAEGSLPWIDGPSGRLTQGPYYDGNTFHRVIDGFVIQGGSPNGLGNDGPGYSFVDEFNSALTHSSAGIMSMANSGPHSNGSQFFITLNPTTNLNSKHVVFGEVIDGLSIVQDLGDVITDSIFYGTNCCDVCIIINDCASLNDCPPCTNCVTCVDRPLTNMVMNSLQILRIGSEAQAFDVSTNQLPVVSATYSTLTGNSLTNLFLTIPANTNTEVYISGSTNLTDWTSDASGFINTTGSLSLAFTSTNTIEYVTTSQINYPHIALLDPTPSSWSLELDGDSFTNTLTITINSNGTSETYTSDFVNYASGTLSNLNYSTSRPYKLNFDPMLTPTTGPQPLYLELDLYFTTATNGVLEGFYVPNYPSGTGFEEVTGSFNLSIP